MQLHDLQIGFGSIKFQGPIKGVSASVTREGNVTTHNPAQVGRPARFDVSFQIQGNIEDSQVVEFQVFALTVPVVDKPAMSAYAHIEAEAARHLAPILRLFADAIEKEVAATEAPREGEADD